MPRPGPRPYECVRRAWHSDRHQPIRGSIIQQIFRVVTEAHSSTTRKNREWQEKIPRVVLKAEEIMYSKANSEAEYVNADTLWERLNDAIDTIIRRDESTETGQFLQPCIEAALVLGCVPVKASRSQRHSNPRCYLNPRFQETPQASPMVSDKINSHGPFSQPPAPSGNQLSIPRPGMVNQASSFALSSSQMSPTTSYTATQTVHHQYPLSFPRPMPCVATEYKSSLNLGSVHPLYHSSGFPNEESQLRFHSAQNSYSNSIIIGRPVGWPRAHPAFFPENVRSAADKNEQVVRTLDSHGKAIEMDCDLSLRLGPSDYCANVDRHLARVNDDDGSSSHHEANKYVELSLFPRHIASDSHESGYNRPEQEELDNNNSNNNNNNNTSLRKRKAGDYQEIEQGSAQRLPNLRHNQFDGETRWPGW
ncbi:hypothetical protein RND81_06G148400 [Saponaria officinalis]|uniref:Histone acetyltransferase n=1 Tax=Saponaria officinalis TaxID=3572 RepID=A0AAW1K6B5_SAPOF